MVKISDFTFSSSRKGSVIHCRTWRPEGSYRGVVQLVHGVAEHIGRYDDFARFLAEHGYVVVGDDHLGHGLSTADDSELGWFGERDGWEHLVQDEKRLHDMLQEEYPDVPMVLFGHSMGSFMARTYLGWYPDDFDACILSGTGHQPAAVCKMGRVLAAMVIAVHGSKFRSAALQKVVFGRYLDRIENPIGPNDWVCRDEEVIRRYDNDPLCGFTGTAGLMYDMMRGLDIIASTAHIGKMDKSKPIFFISGDQDPVGNYGKGVELVARSFQAAGMRDVSIKLYPGDRHEVLNELDKDQVYADVLHWIGEKI